MAISSGSRLGTYEITHQLGAGGMGEVYRAHDSRLGRSVAIKVILQALDADADRVARFEREAKVLAAINHPNIAALYGMEESDGRHFLVMELVEGETLADRLQRGPIAVEDALRIALQIAEALETAHEKGIIHRDLKPANIKITPDEKVKVLDFGLAKAMETESAASNVANSPTLSMMATNAGVILGTAAYMSPEQAKGFAADHRSDVFSFGVVLYEMLTGRQPFLGETAPEILASVLVREPELQRLPPDLNPRLLDLLRRCLDKSPKRRYHAIGDVRAELETIAAAPRVQTAAAAVPARSLRRRAVPAVAVALLAAAAAAALAWRLKPVPVPDVTRFAVALPEGQLFGGTSRHVLAISPDGRSVAYVQGGQLHLRALANLRTIPIPGTESFQAVLAPVFSPDSQWLAFHAVIDGTLKRIPVAGGSAATICKLQDTPLGIHWAGTSIIFSRGDGVYRVAASGGTPEKIVTLDANERAQRVQMLPGNAVLFTASSAGVTTDRWSSAKIYVQRLDGGPRKTLVEEASDGWYLPTGHLLYAQAGTVYAVPFDIDGMEVRGAPVPVIEGVRRSAMSTSGVAWFDISANGTLVYAPGPTAAGFARSDIGLIDRKGEITPLKLPIGSYEYPRMSRDGRRIAVASEQGREAAVLIYDTARPGSVQRLTFGGQNRFPIWTADGSRVVFQSDRGGDAGIYWQPADGSRSAERLTTAGAGESHIPEAWHPHDPVLLFSVLKNSEFTLWTHSLRDRKSAPFGNVRSAVPTDGIFSPDGKWVAYTVGDGPTSTVFVQPYPATGALYQLVRTGGGQPHHAVWSSDGKELIVNPVPPTLDVIAVTTKPTFAFGAGVPAPKGFATGPPSMRRPFDIAPDNRIVGLITPGETNVASSGQLHIVLNWFEELKARAPVR